MNITDNPIVSRAVSQRADDESKLKKSQQKLMDNKRVDQPSNAFHKSVAASGDTYIAEALRNVRKSKISHPESLTRISGSCMHNQMLNSSQEKK